MTAAPRCQALLVRRMGLSAYEPVWAAMRRFVENKGDETPDELWMLQHHHVYTRGLNCAMDPQRDNGIPVVQTDRGGQITYHGPGQIVAYPLLDVRRRGLGVKRLVNLLEQSVIDLLRDYGIQGRRRDKAPGVYVDGRKIAALGVRIRRGCSYHGLSLNADMDLAPFRDIDPCGYRGLEVTQLRDLGVKDGIDEVEEKLSQELAKLLGSGDG